MTVINWNLKRRLHARHLLWPVAGLA